MAFDACMCVCVCMCHGFLHNHTGDAFSVAYIRKPIFSDTFTSFTIVLYSKAQTQKSQLSPVQSKFLQKTKTLQWAPSMPFMPNLHVPVTGGCCSICKGRELGRCSFVSQVASLLAHSRSDAVVSCQCSMIKPQCRCQNMYEEMTKIDLSMED